MPDKCCILHQTHKLNLLVLRISVAAALRGDIFLSAAFLIFPGSPLIKSEAYCTDCDVMKVDFSRGGGFPSGGSGHS